MNRDKPAEPVPAEPAVAQESSFLRRWSQRKRQAKAPESPPSEPPAESALTDADMPPLESLDEKSDYSGFLSPKVSQELRRLALRKLFHAPAFNVTDGLDDYAEDFTTFAALGDVLTQDLRQRLAVEAQRRARSMTAESQTATATVASVDADVDPAETPPDESAPPAAGSLS